MTFYIVVVINKEKKMEIVLQTKCKNYRIEFNGGKTYFLTDSADQCLLACDTLRKAKNRLNKILINVNSEERF